MNYHISDTITYTVNTCKSMIDHVVIKCIAGIGLIAGSFAINDLEIYALTAILGLTVLDALTAMWATKKNGKPLTSRKFGASIVKIVIYGILITGGSLTEIALGFNAGLNEIVMAFIAVREMISVIENIASMGYVVPAKLLNKLSELEE